MFGRKSKIIQEQSSRIRELEELLCPYESHQWVYQGYHFEGGSGNGDETSINHYICKRCRKRLQTWRNILNAEEVDEE